MVVFLPLLVFHLYGSKNAAPLAQDFVLLPAVTGLRPLRSLLDKPIVYVINACLGTRLVCSFMNIKTSPAPVVRHPNRPPLRGYSVNCMLLTTSSQTESYFIESVLSLLNTKMYAYFPFLK